jgi:hypothetical protein
VRALARGLAGLGALAVAGCDGEPSRPPESTPMVTPQQLGAAGERPVVHSLHFVPARAVPGETVQAIASASDPDGAPVTLRYAWRVDGRPLLDSAQMIRVPESAAAAQVEVTVVASDGDEESEPARASFRAGNRAPRVMTLDVDTVERPGLRGPEPHWKVVAEVVDPDRDQVSIRYEWSVDGQVVATDIDELPKSRTRRGDEVVVRATPFDGQAHGPSLASPPFVVGNAAPRIVSAPPDLDPSGTFRYAPEVEDDDGDRHFSFRLLQGPASMQLDTGSGAFVWTPSAADVGSHPVEIEVSDGVGGRSRQRFEVAVRVGGRPAPGPAATR